jgi:hypothetical protein
MEKLSKEAVLLPKLDVLVPENENYPDRGKSGSYLGGSQALVPSLQLWENRYLWIALLPLIKRELKNIKRR